MTLRFIVARILRELIELAERGAGRRAARCARRGVAGGQAGALIRRRR